MREQTLRLLIVVVLALGCADTTTSQTIEPDGPGLPSVPAPVITAEARTALARMSAYLVEAKSLGFSADVVYDVVGFDGQKIQYETQAQADWTHAGQLRINVDGDERQNQIYFNEGQVTFLDKVTNVYATDAVEGGLDAALDEMFVRLELRVPLADLMYSDPYATLMKSAISGRQVGINQVRGVDCIHLAFVAKDVAHLELANPRVALFLGRRRVDRQHLLFHLQRRILALLQDLGLTLTVLQLLECCRVEIRPELREGRLLPVLGEVQLQRTRDRAHRLALRRATDARHR